MMLALWYHGVLAFFYAVVAILLVIVILLQRGRGVGLAGAFGGTGGHTAFGAKTGDVFTWVTVALTGIFLFLAVVANFIFVREQFTTAPIPQGQNPVKAGKNVMPKTNAPAPAVKTTTQPMKP